MLDLSTDIRSLSDFKRNTTEFMTRLEASGNPLVLTVNGKAKIVVQDATGYQRLLERAERAEMMEFLQKSREDIDAGRTFPAEEALAKLRVRHGAQALLEPGQL